MSREATMSARVGAALAAIACASLASAAPPDFVRETGGKPTGPIRIAYEITPTPALGRVLEVSLTIVSAVALDDVTVSFTADASLAFNTAATVQRVAHVASGAAYTATFSVTPLALDVLDLAVTVAGESSGGHEVGTLLIPIRLAAQKSRSPATLRADPAGQGLVHSLPAVAGSGRRAL
jgi:hypothetical protein